MFQPKLLRGFCLTAALVLLGFALPSGAASSVSSEAFSDVKVLTPGAAGVCNNDFIIENLNAQPAEVKVIIGNEDYINEQLQASEKRAYSLKGTLYLARSFGKDVSMDDLATIINTNPRTKLRIRCMNLPENPVPKEDTLRTFK